MNMWLVISIGVLAFAFCCALEIRRRNKRQLFWRLLASAGLCICLVCLINRPTYRTKNQYKNSRANTVLLSPGFLPDSLAVLTGPLHLFSADDDLIERNPALKIKPLVSADNLAAENNLVHVFGYGLKKTDSGLLRKKHIRFHPTLPGGLVKAVWPQVIRNGEVLTFGGRYRNESDKPVKLLLEGAGRLLDSVVVAPQKAQNFALQNKPRLTGPALYRVLALSGSDTLERAPVPFRVLPKKALSVLVLASAPGFENRFLKNWLSAEGYAFALRNTISKGKVSQEFVNMERANLANISQNTLARFDVVVADASAMRQLGTAEKEAIKSAVNDKGLGLVINADSTKTTFADAGRNFPLAATTKNNRKMQIGVPLQNRWAALDEPGIIIKTVDGIQPLIRDEQGQARAAAALFGRGKTVMNALGETYPLVLMGDKAAYASIWTSLIGLAAKRAELRETLWTEPRTARVDEPMRVWLDAAQPAGMPQIFAGKISLAPQQSLEIPYRWSAGFWPRASGWQTFGTTSGAILRQYIFGKADFMGVEAQARYDFTLGLLRSEARQPHKLAAAKNDLQKELPRGLFFMVMFISWAYLWIERKFV